MRKITTAVVALAMTALLGACAPEDAPAPSPVEATFESVAPGE